MLEFAGMPPNPAKLIAEALQVREKCTNIWREQVDFPKKGLVM